MKKKELDYKDIGFTPQEAVNYLVSVKDRHDMTFSRACMAIQKMIDDFNYRVYLCDTEKHSKCSKTNCYINGGECCTTTHKEYSLNEGNNDTTK